MAKTTTTKTAEPLYLLVTEERSHGYLHLYGRIVTQRYESGKGQWLPNGTDDTYGDGLLYSGLRTSCQGDEDSRRRAVRGERIEPVYGFSCEYRDEHSVDLRKAKRMLRTLDKVERGLAKLVETRGYVKSYGEYIGRVAEVVGCAGMGFERRETAYNGNRWDWMSVGDGVNRVNHAIYLWCEEVKPKDAPQLVAHDDEAG
jgi:hypothetical protein